MSCRHAIIASLATLLLVACQAGSDPPKPAQILDRLTQPVVRTSSVTTRANAIQTSALNEATARRYGIARDANNVMLLVTVRADEGASTARMPTRVIATVTDLSGQRREVALRKLRIEDPDTGQPLLDYIGIIETSLPQTLRFEVRVTHADDATSTMRFSQDFRP